MMPQQYSKCLLYAKHLAKHFKCITLFNPQKPYVGDTIISILQQK